MMMIWALGRRNKEVIWRPETLLIYQTNSWVTQNNIKYKSKFEWTVLNGMAPANHIQAAASWLATAAGRATDEVVPAAGLRIS